MCIRELILIAFLPVSGTDGWLDRYSRGIPNYKNKVGDRIVTHKQGMVHVEKYQLSKNDFPFKSKQLTSE